MRRCPACGGFFDGDECPNTHLPGSEEALLPPLPKPMRQRKAQRIQDVPPIGGVVVYQWPEGGPVNCLVTSDPDEDGRVGVMVLTEHVRVSPRDLEEY